MSILQVIKEKIGAVRYYKDIDELPMWNWIKVHEKRETKYLLITNDYEKATDTLKSHDTWFQMMTQFFDKFGMQTGYLEYMKAQKRILMRRIDAYLLNDKTLLTIAEIQELMLKQRYEKQDKPADFMEMAVALEQELRMRIDVRQMTVTEFYTHMKINAEKSKRIKEIQTKWQRR